MSLERRSELLAALEHPEDFEHLRMVVTRMVADCIPIQALLEDLEQIRGVVAPDVEDKVLDVMDLLVGWCAPQFRLVAPPECEDDRS